MDNRGHERHDLRRHATSTPAHPAIVCGTARLSYAELEALANRIANVFRSFGLRRGDHLASLLGNRPEALAVAWAAYRCGLYLTPLATTLVAAELAYLVDDCDARLVVSEGSLRGLAEPLARASRGAVHWLSFDGPLAGFARIEPLIATAAPTPHAHEPAGALMVYTSGTTGAPKGVHRPLPPPDFAGTPAFAADLHTLFGLGDPGVRYLSTAPLYHAAPLRFALAVTAGGGTVHVMDRFDADAALRLLEQHAITHSQWVPTMFQRLLALPAQRRAAFAAPQHRVAVHGAAPCPVATKRSMIDWWGPILLEYYSGSEGIGLTLIDSHEALAHPGSVGRARKGVVHIVDAAGRELPTGETGVVYFSGVAPFGYYKAPDKTAAKTSAQGWQTFGDMGHVDAQGWLTLSDRLDDMIIAGGVNLYPQEIEAAMLEVDGVSECAVVGAADERFGERPVAFIVPAHAARDDTAALLEHVRAHNRRRLGRHKQPEEIHLIDQLPRNVSGKVLRRRLRELLAVPRIQSTGATMTSTTIQPTRFTFTGRDGLAIAAYRWDAIGPARGIVQLTHGMGEHVRRYDPLAAALNAKGFVVYGQDHRGHGASAASEAALGQIGAAGWVELVNDIDLLVSHARDEQPGLPLVLLGHSMGSFAVQQYLLDHSARVHAAVLTGTAAIDLLEPALDLDAALDLAMFNAAFAPARTDYDWLSRDPAQVDRYVADPRCGFGLDVPGVKAMFAAARPLADGPRLAKLRAELPLYIAVGDADPVNGQLALVKVLVERYRAAGLTDVTLRVYEGARHELFNETNRAEVVAELLAWLDRVVRDASPMP